MSGFSWHGIPGPAALLLAADIYMRLDWFEPSLQALEEHLRGCPEDLDARRKQGLVMLLLNRDEEAERILISTARREQHRIPATLAYIALLEAKRGRLDESLHLLLQAHDLAPFDDRIEHSLLRIEALRVRMKRAVSSGDGVSASELVPGMTAGMLQLHGYGKDKAERAARLWRQFLARRQPGGRKPAIWAAALEYLVTRAGPHYSQEQLAVEYGVSATQLREHLQELESEVPEEDLRGEDLLASTAFDGAELQKALRSQEIADVLSSLTERLGSLDSPGEAAAWVFERVPPASDPERHELEEFIGWLWTAKRRGR
jgi:tetratricopeptide (TPR) repeat protein